jgi:hypothetical protein
MEHRSTDELPCKGKSFLPVEIVLDLADKQVATNIALPGIETPGIKAIVVEEMHNDTVLSEERKKLRVQVHLGKEIEVADVFNGDRLPINLPVLVFPLNVEGILSSP